MRERKKPSQSWMERTRYEFEHEDELLAKRIELLNDIRKKKLLYADSEAFKIGYEAGFAKACEILHDFAHDVYAMRYAQSDKQAAIDNSDQENAHRMGLITRELEDKVDAWIRENYNYFETDYEED